VPDISELMHAATGESATRPDLVAVTARARVLRRQQQVGRASVAAAVALLVIPAVSNSWRGGSDALEQLPPATPNVDATSTPGPTPAAVRSEGPSIPLAVGAAVSPDPVPSRRTGATPAAVVTAQPDLRAEPGRVQSTAPPPTGTYAPGSSCSVSTTAMAPGTSQSCRFTATAVGGWRLSFSSTILPSRTELGLIEVYRNGRATRYDAWDPDEKCLDDAVQPGDLVTVTVKQDDQGHTDFELGAGSTWTCRR